MCTQCTELFRNVIIMIIKKTLLKQHELKCNEQRTELKCNEQRTNKKSIEKVYEMSKVIHSIVHGE